MPDTTSTTETDTDTDADTAPVAEWQIHITAPRHADLRDTINAAMRQLIDDLTDAAVPCEAVAFNGHGDAFNDWATPTGP